MSQNKKSRPVLAHRNGRNKELTKKLTIIVPLLRTAVKMAAVTLGLYILAAVAAINVPGLIGGVLVLNALLGAWFALEEVVAT